MPEHKKEEEFRVIDRRLFTAEGELRPEALDQERRDREVTAKNEARQAASAAPVVSAQAPAPAAETPRPSPPFENLVRLLGSNAAMVLGAYADPRSGQPVVDPDAARELIDMLDALAEKTRGNLAPEEKDLLTDLTAKLKMTFLEISQAAAKTMQAQAKGRG